MYMCIWLSVCLSSIKSNMNIPFCVHIFQDRILCVLLLLIILCKSEFTSQYSTVKVVCLFVFVLFVNLSIQLVTEKL